MSATYSVPLAATIFKYSLLRKIGKQNINVTKMKIVDLFLAFIILMNWRVRSHIRTENAYWLLKIADHIHMLLSTLMLGLFMGSSIGSDLAPPDKWLKITNTVTKPNIAAAAHVRYRCPLDILLKPRPPEVTVRHQRTKNLKKRHNFVERRNHHSFTS